MLAAFTCSCSIGNRELLGVAPDEPVALLADGLSFRPIAIDRGNAIIKGYVIRPACPTGAMFYFHGLDSTLEESMPQLRWMALELHLTVISFDYRGRGVSSGQPDFTEIANDALVIFDTLSSELDLFPGEPIVAGHSLGASLAAGVASQRAVKDTILLAPATSLEDAVASWRAHDLVVAALYSGGMRDELLSVPRTDVQIQKVESPVLIAHGSEDRIIEQRLGLKVFSLATRSPRACFCDLKGAGHEDATLVNATVRKLLKDFLAPSGVPLAASCRCGVPPLCGGGRCPGGATPSPRD